jgi:mxaL protein
MAWGPDSNVERGLYGSILATKRLAVPTHLVFITDGEQNVKELHRPPLNRYHGMISGFIFGAGGLVPSPIPKLDQNNQLTGYWKNAEVEEYKISLDRVENAMSEELDPQSNYWSRLHQEDLQVLAGITGLIYQRLESPEQFSKTLISDTFAEPRSIESDVRGFIATLALLLLLAVYIRQFGPENN